MPSIDSLKASDGTGPAAVATVQSVRAPAATTIVVDTVENIPTNFHGTMGTPHTFVDPVTSEQITVISEATAVDFKGHVDGTDLEIDTIAPGFTDAGSAVNDIVIIKPTTQWADEVADVLEVSHDDDGTLKDDTVDTDQIVDGAVTTAKIAADAVTAAKIDWASTGAGAGIWWEELGRTTLGSAGDTITVSSLPARKYLKVIVSLIPSSSIDGVMRFNNDTGSNYAYNRITNGTSASNTSATSISMNPDSIAQQKWAVADIVNIASQEKSVLTKSMSIGAAGAGTVPAARDTYGKWVNTSSQITQIDIVNLAAGDFAIGSEVVVLGHD